MHAIVTEQAGGPETMQLTQVADLTPKPGELLVQTVAVGVNFIETYQRAGIYHVQYPFTPGTEASGTVLAVGAGVTNFAVGDRVATAGTLATYAEQFVVPAAEAVRVPDTVELITAAAIPLQACTAHYLAHSASRPQQGDTVLVHAGAGGVGLLLTQMLVAKGITVFTTASTEAKRELSRSAGATQVFDYEDFAEQARARTAGEGVAVVYDGVGATTFEQSLSALRVRGEMVLFGGASGQVPPFDLQRLNGLGSLSVTRPKLQDFMRTEAERAWRYTDIFAALAAGTLNLRIGATFPLAEAAAAHHALESRSTTGKVLLTL